MNFQILLKSICHNVAERTRKNFHETLSPLLQALAVALFGLLMAFTDPCDAVENNCTSDEQQWAAIYLEGGWPQVSWPISGHFTSLWCEPDSQQQTDTLFQALAFIFCHYAIGTLVVFAYKQLGIRKCSQIIDSSGL
jgi:hypothetical protein